MNLGTWHYCYVGVSRVQSFEQITKVDIPNIASNSVSAILSVKSPTDEALKSFDSVINGEQLASRMKTFHYYDLSVGERDNPHICFEAMCLVKKFYRTTDLVERRKFFRSIQTKYYKFFSKTLTPPENTSFPLTNETGAGYGILKNRRSLMALSRVQNDLVVSVWLKEFLELEKQEGNTPDWWSERYLVVETMSLYNECNLSDRLPPPGMSTEQMIENASSILVGDEDDLPEGTQMSRLISKTLNEFGRNTWQFSKSTFLAKTYRKKLKQEAITKPWLITQLTAILQEEKGDVDLETKRLEEELKHEQKSSGSLKRSMSSSRNVVVQQKMDGPDSVTRKSLNIFLNSDDDEDVVVKESPSVAKKFKRAALSNPGSKKSLKIFF